MVTQHAIKDARYQPKGYFLRRKSIQQTHKAQYHLSNFKRAYRSWLLPYIKIRVHSNGFRPLLSFLYTDLNCNLNCQYCYSRGKKVPGMSMQTARDAVDWLYSVGCRVLAYMGGEPLVRKQFIIDLTRYAVDKGFFVYLPTNGILLDKAFIDDIGHAGVATVNLAVDAAAEHQGLPKYFNRIRKQFDYLVQQEKKYGYITFFNINITPRNTKDVKELTRIAHEYGIATAYHINEQPLIEYDMRHSVQDGGWITEADIESVDELIDWLIERNLGGYTMVNSVEHLRAMKLFIRNQLAPWPCRAGRLSMIIRVDGSFAPCMELLGTTEDWGNVYEGPKFDEARLTKQKKACSPHCLSTCNYQVQHYTQSMMYSLQWVVKHAYAHFLGIS
ncbi:MAG: radical SAM protein [Bacteroidia bacterium]|nr:radical SAM protein [Bacteroidia bacterium]